MIMLNNSEDIALTIIFKKFSEYFGIEDSFIKYEGLNIAGSIKLKTAKYLLDGLEKEYNISPNKNIIIESSSGNLGIALSILCRIKKYQFICITDPNTLPIAEKYMELYGAKIIKVTEKDESGGYLAKRISLIHSLLKNNSNMIWTNQYASKYNVLAHYSTTAKEIFERFPNLDYLFIGAGTTGTLVGCAKFFKEYSPKTKIIAVDTKGSITFGFPSSPRYIPGIGTSRIPEITSTDNIHDIILVSEEETVINSNQLLREYGLFLGGSSATVLWAAKQYIKGLRNKNISLVALSPDFGEKYIDTIYNPKWVEEKFGSIIRDKAFI
jgi:2,3-diaminopropionate biosynthesis protein SbnA